MSLHEFHVNEFAVQSDFSLPYDAQMRSPCAPRDTITLRRASLAHIPSTLRQVRRQLVYDVGDGFLIEPNGLALHIDLKGRVLTVDCADEKLSAAAAWAFHAGLGAATVTRGGVPLHGAGLEVAGHYVALMASSGSGKSTLSWHLLQHGARFGNDDLISAYLTGDGIVAYLSVSMFPKLQREAVDRHGLDYSALMPADYGTNEEEYYAPMPAERRIPAPAPLAAAFLLRPRPLASDGLPGMEPSIDLVAVRRLSEDEAAATFQANLHALWLIGKWVDDRRIRALCHSLAARVPLFELTYPKTYALLPALSDTITQIAEAL